MSDPRPALRCPHCVTVDMRVERGPDGGTEVDFCPECGGLWLDRGELDAAVGAPAAGTSLEAMRRRLVTRARVARDCPCCAERMRTFELTRLDGVHFEECAEHGIFLDAGELEAIRARVAGTEPASGAAVEELRATDVVMDRRTVGLVLDLLAW